LSSGVHTTRVAKKFEWFGLAIIKRYLQKTAPVKDVHYQADYFSKGIDLIVEGAPSYSIDLKVDSYIGSDPSRKIRGLCNPDSRMILIETLSQLQYDRTKSDVKGWFFTSEADEIFYYYLALLNDEAELTRVYSEYREAAKQGAKTATIENRLISSLKVDNDLLVSYSLSEARKWYECVGSRLPVSWSGAPNPTYVTVSRRIPREMFLAPRGPGRNMGRVYPKIR
jgi:hypothetical protein